MRHVHLSLTAVVVYRLGKYTGAPVFPHHLRPDADGLIAVGGELDVATLVEAYQKGIFPWTGERPIPWFSPDPRMVLVPEQFHLSRSLRRVVRRQTYQVRFDHDFAAVIRACAQCPRSGQTGTWIKPNMIRAYRTLHRLGIAHSVEAYRDGGLAGGLYGLAFGRGFFGESMFSHQRDASKVALYTLAGRLAQRGYHFIDCQQVTAHLARLGAVAISRREYLAWLGTALTYESEHLLWARETSTLPAEDDRIPDA